jgi:VanZ family protein
VESTTSLAISRIARYLLAVLVVLGSMAWWWPRLAGWGGLTAALLVVLVLWLLGRTLTADRRAPGNPFHVALVGPCAILAWHWVGTNFQQRINFPPLCGAVNVSMIFAISLLALAAMLSQSLFAPRLRVVVAPRQGPPTARLSLPARVLLAACGVAMLGGAALALAMGQVGAARSAVAMLGWTGAMVLLAAADVQPSRPMRLDAVLWPVTGLLAAAGAVVLALLAPAESAGAVVLAGVAAMAVGLAGRRVRLAVGGGLLAAAAGAALWWKGSSSLVMAGAELARAAGIGGAFGLGENAFAHGIGTMNCGAVLLATVGWTGAIWVAAMGLLAAGAVLAQGAAEARSPSPPDAPVSRPPLANWHSVFWMAAALTAAAAMLSPGGLFIPAATLAVGLTWGLLPAMLGRRPRQRRGVLVLAMVVAVFAIEGAATIPGLVVWMAQTASLPDSFVHFCVGVLLTLVLLWLIASRRPWLAAVATPLSIVIGGAAEVVQGAFFRRSMELGDLAAHCIGAACAVAMYLLVLGARRGQTAADASPPR